MISVIVLAGGNSDEREVSLRSGAAVTGALIEAGYEVQQLDPADDIENEALSAADVVFPVLHGKGGEDGELQARLEDLGIAFVGTGSEASALCFDKWDYKQFIGQHGLPTPTGAPVDETGFWKSELITRPYVLKPNDEGSSVDALIARDSSVTPDVSAIAATFGRHETMLLEELITGTEITVAVLGNEALPVIEIIPPASGEFDYENKYNGKTQELCPPEHVSSELQAAAEALALRAHRLTGCRDFSRTDIMISQDNKLYILETNTIPGMTEQSLFPKAAYVHGLSMVQLVDRLVRSALVRKI